MKGLIIRSPWIDKILAGEKTWEMRSRPTSVRGRIALIRAGSGQIVGTADLVDCLPPLSEERMRETFALHGIPESQIGEVLARGWVLPWVLRDVIRLPEPVPYRHPNGAVNWVELPDMPQFSDRESADESAAQTFMAEAAALEPLTPEPVSMGDSTSAWVDIPLSAGNIRNNHFYLRSAARLLPVDVIGGPNRKSLAAHTLTVSFEPGTVVHTDVAGDKMILRLRAPVGDFFTRSGAKAGDCVRFLRKGSHQFHVSLRPAAN